MNETQLNDGSAATIDNIRANTSVITSQARLATGSGLRIYISNTDNGSDLIITDGHLSIIKSN